MWKIPIINNKKFIEKSINIHGNKYNYSVSEYINNNTKIKILCNKCKEYFFQIPHSHLKNHGCFNCYGNKKLTTDKFIELANHIHANKYDYSNSEYINNRIKIKILCKKCNEYFFQSFKKHLYQYQGCFRCKISKGEEKIKKILIKNKIEFKEQYKFLNQNEEIKLCRFDFFIPKINSIIEFQGQQHFEFIKYFHKNNDNYLKSWYRDILKKEFCLENNINLIEIKYNENIKIRLEIENII